MATRPVKPASSSAAKTVPCAFGCYWVKNTLHTELCTFSLGHGAVVSKASATEDNENQGKISACARVCAVSNVLERGVPVSHRRRGR